jgi:peptidoglycan/xylan/chitin deacetylase (PgdA/CDA1 family)
MLPAVPALSWLAGTAALAAGGYHYAALWPASRLFGRALVAGADPAEIALTYDDGPNDPYTGQLLEVLARHQVRATFFLIGRYARQKPHIVRMLQRAGHLLGSHTMTHPSLMYRTASRIHSEMAQGKDALEDIVGQPVRYFRPPFGARTPAVFRIARELDLTPVLWNASGHDWATDSAAEIEARLRQGIARNRRRDRSSNLLLHDGGHIEMGTDRRRTVTATANLLAGAAETGMRFVTVDAWPADGDLPDQSSAA